MHSHFEIHTPEGRHWHDLVEALGQPTPYFRSGIGPYVEATGMGIIDGANTTRQMQSVLPAEIPLTPEIENYPHSRFGKSIATVRADLVLGQLFGLPEMTFSIYRMSERLDLELQRDDAWERLLRENKPYLQAIANLDIQRDQFRGVSLLLHEEVARYVRGATEQIRPIMLYRQRPWDTALPMLGVATRYGMSGEVTALAGEQVCCMSDEELRAVFSKGVILDARAAESLILMGKGELVGLVERLPDAPGVTETITDPAFGGLQGDIINLRNDGTPWQFALLDGARVISRVRDYTLHDVGHGVVLYENALGGRTAVVPLDSQQHLVSLGVPVEPIASSTFLNWPRQAQMLDVLRWLGRGPLPLFVPGATGVLPLRIDQENRIIVGVTNVCYDTIDSLTLELAAPGFQIKSIRTLRPNAQWETISATINEENGLLKIDTGLRLPFLETAVLVLE